jgi:hypothetical protein
MAVTSLAAEQIAVRTPQILAVGGRIAALHLQTRAVLIGAVGIAPIVVIVAVGTLEAVIQIHGTLVVGGMIVIVGIRVEMIPARGE